MKCALVVLCAVLVGAIALPTPILEPRFQSGAPAPVMDKKAQATAAQDRATKLTTEANKLPATSHKRAHLLKKAEKAQMDFEQYTAEAATDDLVPKPQVVGFGTDRLPDAQVPGEVPKTLLTNREVDIVARNVLAAARKNVCNKKGEYCDLKLAGEFKKGPSGDSNNMAKWKAEFLAKHKGKGKRKGRHGKRGKGRKGRKGKRKGRKGGKKKAKAKKDARKGKKDKKKANKDKQKAKKLARKGAVKAAKSMKKASKLNKKASTDRKKAAKAAKNGKRKRAKKLEKKAKKEEKKAKTQEKKAKKNANKVPKTKEACAKAKGKWDKKKKKCTLKKK